MVNNSNWLVKSLWLLGLCFDGAYLEAFRGAGGTVAHDAVRALSLIAIAMQGRRVFFLAAVFSHLALIIYFLPDGNYLSFIFILLNICWIFYELNDIYLSNKNKNIEFYKLLPFKISISFFYIFAGIHKLNYGFIGEFSCTKFLNEAFHHTYFLPKISDPIAVTGLGIFSALAQISLGFFILTRRPFFVSALICFLIQIPLGIRFVSFSLAMISITLLLLPNAFKESLQNQLSSTFQKWTFQRPYLWHLAFVLLVIMTSHEALNLHLFFNHWKWHRRAIAVTWLIIIVPIFLFFIKNLFNKYKKSEELIPEKSGLLKFQSVVLSTFLGIICFIQGSGPYTGLGTSYAFNMFSNLRTEDQSNHLFIGRDTFRILPFLDNQVEVISMKPHLPRVEALPGWKVTLWTLMWAARDFKNAGGTSLEISMLHENGTVTHHKNFLNEIKDPKYKWEKWSRKFVRHLAIPPKGHDLCRN